MTVAALLTACAGAQAKTVQLGSPLTASFTPAEFCAGGYTCGNFTGTLVQTAFDAYGGLPEPGAHVSSPVDGTVIS